MSEPAKDEAELVERVAKAIHDSVYGEQSAWMDVSKFERSYREMEADAVIRAIRAAGWAVVPMELTEEMRRAAWKAQYRFANVAFPKPKSEKKVQQLVQTHVDDRYQQEQDRMAYAAMLAAAPGVKP